MHKNKNAFLSINLIIFSKKDLTNSIICDIININYVKLGGSFMEPVFRNSVFGFNKQDVSDFILKQNKRAQLDLKEKDEIIADLENQVAELKKELHEYSDFENTKKENHAALESIFQLNMELKEFLSQCVAEAENEKENARKNDEAIAEINKNLERTSEMIKKAEKFDALSNLLSGMVNNSENNTIDDYSDVIHSDVNVDASFEKFVDNEQMMISEISVRLGILVNEIERLKL